MKLKDQPSFSKIGATFGLTLALSSVLAAGMGTILMGKRMMVEDRAYVQQSIGDTSSILAKHFKVQFQLLVDDLIQKGEEQVQIFKKDEGKSTASGTGYSIQIGSIEMNPDLLDLSVWKKGKEAGAFDLFPLPKRVYLAVNSKYEDPSSDLVQQLQASELVEKSLVQPAFQGHTVITLSPKGIGDKNTILIVTPLSSGETEYVVVSHIRLRRFQSALIREGLVSISLVDDFGNILAHPDPLSLGKKDDQIPLFQTMHSSNLTSGQMFYDENGSQYLGGYHRVGIARLAVLAQVPESEISAGVKVLGKQTALFLVSCFLTFFVLGYIVYTRTGFVFYERRRNSHDRRSHDGNGAGSLFPVKDTKTQKVGVTVIYGSLRQLNQILELPDAADSVDAINDFFNLAYSCIRAYGGSFEKVSGSSFIGVWGLGQPDGTEIWCALKTGLEIRKHLSKLNGARRVDAHKPISIGMGVHTGLAVVGKMGPIKNLQFTILGEVIPCAKYLARLSDSRQTDFLISQEAWTLSDGKFIGEQLGEAKLTTFTGMTGYYSISGFRDEKGEALMVEISPEGVLPPSENISDSATHVLIVNEKKILRWMIDNGSQMVGPLSEQEIASRLFSQELDFDCKCWSEGTGNSAQIRNAGIFSGSEDSQANLWLYDGKTIHGPVLSGFLITASKHGAIDESTYVCETSTVNGWVPFTEWIAKHSTASPGIESHQDEALRASLAPPVSTSNSSQLDSTEKKDSPTESPHPLKKAA